MDRVGPKSHRWEGEGKFMRLFTAPVWNSKEFLGQPYAAMKWWRKFRYMNLCDPMITHSITLKYQASRFDYLWSSYDRGSRGFEWVLASYCKGMARLFSPINWPGCKADRLPQSSAESKNEWNYTSITQYVFRSYRKTILFYSYVSK
jgi:hypothetical protein